MLGDQTLVRSRCSQPGHRPLNLDIFPGLTLYAEILRAWVIGDDSSCRLLRLQLLTVIHDQANALRIQEL